MLRYCDSLISGYSGSLSYEARVTVDQAELKQLQGEDDEKQAAVPDPKDARPHDFLLSSKENKQLEELLRAATAESILEVFKQDEEDGHELGEELDLQVWSKFCKAFKKIRATKYKWPETPKLSKMSIHPHPGLDKNEMRTDDMVEIISFLKQQAGRSIIGKSKDKLALHGDCATYKVV